MLRMIILSHNMACHDFDTFIDQELGTIGQGGCSPVPSARTGMAGLLCRLQGCFGIGMGNPSAGVFGLSYRPTRHKTRLIVLARPNVIRYLGYRRDKENGVMGVHGSKDKISMCQTAAASTVHGHGAGAKCTGWTERRLCLRVNPNTVIRFLCQKIVHQERQIRILWPLEELAGYALQRIKGAFS